MAHKGTVRQNGHAVADPNPEDQIRDLQERPRGWMYKSHRVFGRELWYASPKVQLLIVALCCFLSPGMYNALAGLGAGGQQDSTIQAHAGTAMFSTAAAVGLISGTIANRLGLRFSLVIGGLGYSLFAASFLCFSHTHKKSFVIAASIILGVCSSLLWTAQGTIVLSYPSERSKGRYISWFWVIFNLGGVIGSLISFCENRDNSTGTVTDGTYGAFISLMAVGACLGVAICKTDKVIRDDGSRIIPINHPSWSSELRGLWMTIRSETWIIALLPMFFVSNIYYTYQNNGFNANNFNTRTRALNSLIYWLAQIFGALLLGHALDYNNISRKTRARLVLAGLFAVTMILWGCGWAWHKHRPSHRNGVLDNLIDFRSSEYLAPMFLYLFYGVFDAFWQTTAYWLMGALSNSARKSAHFAGFYKAFQSTGAAVFWRLDALHVSYDTIFRLTWSILAFAVFAAMPVAIWGIKNHVEPLDDRLSDEEKINPPLTNGVPDEAEV